MSAITFADLVQVALKAQPADLDDTCGVCRSEPGQPCVLSCPNRGECAMDEVADLIGDLPREDFMGLLRTGMEREMNGDRAPGFEWAWAMVNEEAQSRGLGYPVGV
ncbi:hypothetical protein ACFY64_31765 [Streptomyces collinus]|uniref:hypothetical protein n=1 Tax=Streptomyces collinus TaxID=42684 RepID=UPI0036CC1E3D